MSLTQYNEKRHFNDTSEPKGKAATTGKHIFVVQRHQASHLHYDFRLEMDGVLKSWAVPKGPSMNPKDKRLAMMVEDHPVSYAKFEGVIPEGNYGAGIVEVWDTGTYELAPDSKGSDITGIEQGSLKFTLHGKKLKGQFALIKLKKGAKNAWLLIKDKDGFAINEPYDSEQQTDQHSPVSNASQKKKDKRVETKRSKVQTPTSTGNKAVADAVTPMMTGETRKPFSGTDWIFEIKWDGYRAIADCRKQQSLLYSRNAISFAEKYPVIFKEIQAIKTPMMLDGEIVVLNEEGKPDFQKLQLYAQNDGYPILYYVFDILQYKGKDITRKTLLERKALLQKVLPQSDIIRYCDHVENDGEAFFKLMQERNLEGMIAKRKDSMYLPGERSKSWLKVKHQLIDEAVIAGFTKPEGARKYFGSLILGQYKKGELVYVGHTGTGFDTTTLKTLHDKMLPLVIQNNPFGTKIPVNNTVTWIQPKLVANIHYTELTKLGIMRHPVFHGLRIDKTVADMKKGNSPAPKSAIQKAAKQQTEGDDKELTVDGITLQLSNLDKLFWPEEQLSKGDLVMYYNEVYPHIIPYLEDRPQSMRRNPNGIADAGFFQKDVGDTAPEWAKTVSLFSESNNKNIDYLVCNNKATLLYMANLGCIELNPWNSRIKKIDNPDYLVLDLDPSETNSFEDVIQVALLVKELLDKAGAAAYCKTSGATGLHIYVPLGAKYTYEEARLFAALTAHLAADKAPELATIERSINRRNNKLYIDYLQNKRGQTLAAPYSARPKPGAPVSAPLDWKEVKKGLHPAQFTIQNITKRLKRKGDLFHPVLDKGVNLKSCLKKLEKL